MMTWTKTFEAWPKQVVILACILFVTLVGLVDYFTGHETFFFTFYLLAIFLGTWRVSVAFGVLMSALSVTAWMSANIEAGASYSNYFIPVWNAAIMFVIYLIIVLLLARVKQINAELEERVRLRTAALTAEMQERMRLQKELLEVSDRERRRIGRSLHDGLCQHLTGTSLAGHLLEQKLATQPQAGEASRLVQLIEESIEMTRGLSHELDPGELIDGSLVDQLEDLAAGVNQRYKVACRFESHLAGPLSDPVVARHLYRIAQEGVLAAVRRSRTTQIHIGLDLTADEIVLTIQDDGAPPAGGAGAEAESRAVAYRCDLIGARLHLDRLDSQGTRLTCVLPNNVEKHA